MKSRTLLWFAGLLAITYLPFAAETFSVTTGPSIAHAAGGQGKAEKAEKGEQAEKGDKVHLPGNLNAAHASATAREHANPNSQVGKIALYEALARYEECEEEGLADCTDFLEGFVDLDLTSLSDVSSSGSVLIDAANKPIDDGFGEVLSGVRDAIFGLLGIVDFASPDGSTP